MIAYPLGQEPTLWDPVPPVQEHRFALGRATSPSPSDPPPLVVIGMNPSVADAKESDRTVNRIIKTSADHGYSGWIMMNLYPERAADPAYLTGYDPQLSAANCRAIEGVIDRYQATEVLGAWGNPNRTIRRAFEDVHATLTRLNVRVFHLDDLTQAGHPRHPNPRGSSLPMTGPKRYLVW